jgi:hypothetical protein
VSLDKAQNKHHQNTGLFGKLSELQAFIGRVVGRLRRA